MAKNSSKPVAAKTEKPRKRHNKMSAPEVLGTGAVDVAQPDALQELLTPPAPAGEPSSPRQLAFEVEAGVTIMAAWRDLKISDLNPRRTFDQAELKGLADSIETARAVLQNLTVRAAKGGVYEIVSGERRYKAVGLLIESGRATDAFPMPCVVRQVSDAELLRLAVIENVQRQDMHPLDEAQAFADMIKDGATTESIANDIGKTARFVQVRLQMLNNLTADAKKAFRAGEISVNQARVLAMRGDKTQKAALKELQDDDGVSDSGLLEIMTRDLPLQSIAKFDLAKYTGGFVEDPDGADGPWFKDAKEFWRLQREWVADRVKELKASKQFKFVNICQPTQWFHEYEWPQRPGHKAAGAIIQIERDGGIVEHLNVVDRDTLQKDQQQAAKVRDAKARKESGGVSEPYTKRNAVAVRKAKTRALQLAIASDPQHAIDMALLSLIASGYESGLRPYAIPHQVIHPTVLAKLTEFKAKLPGLQAIDKERPNSGEGVLRAAGYNDQSRASLIAAILALPKAKRTELFTLLVATRFCVGGLYEAGHGEDANDLAIAKHVGAEVDGDEAFTPEYLETLRKPYLITVAASLKIRDVDGKALEACSGTQLRAAIRAKFEQLEAGAKIPALPEFEFTTRSQIDKAIRETLREQAKAA